MWSRPALATLLGGSASTNPGSPVLPPLAPRPLPRGTLAPPGAIHRVYLERLVKSKRVEREQRRRRLGLDTQGRGGRGGAGGSGKEDIVIDV